MIHPAGKSNASYSGSMRSGKSGRSRRSRRTQVIDGDSMVDSDENHSMNSDILDDKDPATKKIF